MKVTLMADISLRANVGCEKSTCVLEIRDAHLRCLSCERYSRALSKQLNDATSDAGCQIEHVVDCDCVVDYFRRLKSQLNQEACDETTKILTSGPSGEGAGLESAC